MKFSKYNLIVPGKDEEQFFLFNTFNGSCFNIDRLTADIVRKKSIESLSEENKELFTLSNVIIQDNINEDHIFAYLQGHVRYDTKKVVSTVLLTLDCNLRCPYCFQGLDKATETMTFDQADKYVSFIINTTKKNDAKSVFILLFGGEPLINVDVGIYILEKIKLFCDENDVAFSSGIITNGTLLNTQIINKLYDLNCRMMQITLDGIKSIHDTRRMYKSGKGSFEDIMGVLRILNDNIDINTVVRVNVDKMSLDGTYLLLEDIGKYGANITNCYVDFGIVRTEGTACSGYSKNCFIETEIGDVLYDLWNYAEKQGFRYNIKPGRKFFYCGLYGDNQYTITPNLDVYKCWEHVGNPEHLMGRINEHGHFVDQTHAFYDWMSVDPLKNDTCKVCVYLPTCGGGCGTIAYNETGSYHANGCFKVKGTIEKQVLKFVEGIVKAKNE